VMLSYLGGAGEFGPELLNADDWKEMKRSRIVCTLNWAANRRGTELVREIKKRVGSGTVFLDPADVRDRITQYRSFLAALKREHLVDWLSANEHEARATARLLGLRTDRLAMVCRQVAEELSVRFDVHTEGGSFTSDGGEVLSHRVRRVRPRVLTGAGDVWDAASVHFFLSGANHERRIELADLAAGLYLRSKEASAPTSSEVRSLLEHA